MAFQLSGVPFALDQSTAGMPDLVSALAAGQKIGQSSVMFPQILQQAKLANQLQQIKNQYAPQEEAAALQKSLLANQYYGPGQQSEIGLRNAQANQANQLAQWVGPQAQADIGLTGANTQNIRTQNALSQLKLNALSQALGNGPVSNDPNDPMHMGTVKMQDSGQQANDQGGQDQSSAYGQSSYGQQQPTNSIYGIETPKMTSQDITNNMLFGTNSYQARLDNAKQQQQDQYNLFKQGSENAINAANELNKQSQMMNVFNQAMDQSTYKGQSLGHLPSHGPWTIFMGNNTPEQIADQAAAMMSPQAIQNMRQAMGSGQFSDIDMKVANSLNVANRTMNDDVRKFYTDWTRGVAQRGNEHVSFMRLMGNPTANVTKQDADALWANYQRDFPISSKDNKTVMHSNLNKWAYYTTPQAIKSIKETGSYTPSQAELKNEMMKFPPDSNHSSWWIAPVPRNKVGQAVRRGGKYL